MSALTLAPVVLMTSNASASVSWFAVAFCAFTIVVCLFTDWRFRTGWQMTSGRLGPRTPALRPVYVRISYAALPAVAVGCGFLGLSLFIPVASSAHGDAQSLYAVLALVAIAVVIAAGVWLLKEFYRPTARRTPEWLREPSGQAWLDAEAPRSRP